MLDLVSVGLWQLYRAAKQVWQLRQSFLYLIGYFLLGDSLNTTVTVIATLQVKEPRHYINKYESDNAYRTVSSAITPWS
jgi:hypothetical protein